MQAIDNLRAVGPHGMGKVIEAEAQRLSYGAGLSRPPRSKKPIPGTVVWPFERALADLLLTYARCPSRLYHDRFSVRENRLEPLYDQLVDADVGAALLSSHRRFSVVAKRLDGFDAGVRQVVGTVKNALQKSVPEATVDAKHPQVTIALSMIGDALVLSKLLTTESMASRGYRTERTEAPLRENLAACLLMLARFDARTEALIDPMCGSGTIVIEAGLMARGASLRGDDDDLFSSKPTLWASDVSRHACEIAERNGKRAGVSFSARTMAYRNIQPGDLPPGLIIANLPFGERLAQQNIDKATLDFVAWAARHKDNRAAILVPAEFDPRQLPTRPTMDKLIFNGPIRTRFIVL